MAQLATLTPNQRLEACNFYEPDEYLIDEESKPHIYAVDINENAIPKEEKDAPEAPGMSMQKSLQEEDTSKGKAPLMEEETPATLPIDTKLKNVQLQPLEVKKTEEEKKKVEMIYDQDIGFACRPKSGNKKGFVISYGFAREMLFVSDLVGEINPQEKFLGRKMKLKGYLFSPPQIEKLTQEQLEEKYYSLRVRTGEMMQTFLFSFLGNPKFYLILASRGRGAELKSISNINYFLYLNFPFAKKLLFMNIFEIRINR